MEKNNLFQINDAFIRRNNLRIQKENLNKRYEKIVKKIDKKFKEMLVYIVFFLIVNFIIFEYIKNLLELSPVFSLFLPVILFAFITYIIYKLENVNNIIEERWKTKEEELSNKLFDLDKEIDDIYINPKYYFELIRILKEKNQLNKINKELIDTIIKENYNLLNSNNRNIEEKIEEIHNIQKQMQENQTELVIENY